MYSVVYNLVKPLRDRYHHIFTDKLYTGVEIAVTLFMHNKYMMGAIKSNAWGLLQDLVYDKRVNPDAKHMAELNRCVHEVRPTSDREVV
jgi:hypothetical protein